MNRMTLLALFTLIACLAAADGYRTPRADSEEKDLGVVYARLKLELAEVKLKSAKTRNEQIPGAVAGDVVVQLRDNVELARQDLSQAQAAGMGDSFGSDLRRARVEAKAADSSWRNAVKAAKRAPRLFSPLNIQLLELRAEIARINYEQGRAVAQASSEVKLRWQLRFLQDRVERLQDEVSRESRPAARWHRWPL